MCDPTLLLRPLFGGAAAGLSHGGAVRRGCTGGLNLPRVSLFCLVLFALCLSIQTCTAADWPQWLGPQRDSVWSETGIIRSFPTNGLPLLWRAPIGPGYAGPAVANGRVYLMDRQLASGSTNSADPFARSSSVGRERVLCLDANNGQALWSYDYECRYTVSYPAGPRVMPLVQDGKVFTLGSEGNLHCLDAQSGKVNWAYDFKGQLGVKAPMWGFAGHPLIDGDRLICIAAGPGSTAIALDKNTGQELWRALSADEPGYSSPVIYDLAGRRELIIVHAEAANGLNPETGEVYWSVPFKSRYGLSVATPRLEGGRLFITSFYNGSLMLEPARGQAQPATLWRTEKGDEVRTTHLNSIIPTPFLENGFIYGVCSHGQLRCLNAATGERVWETFAATTDGRPVRWANAFLVKHEDRFFLFNEKGELIIARLSPAGYEEVSRTRLLDPTNRDPGRLVVWSHPAFANRRVYARNDKELVCYDLSATASSTKATATATRIHAEGKANSNRGQRR